MLWLCLHLPCLPLEVYTRANCAPDGDVSRSPALVVSEGQGRAQHVLMANVAAAQCGIRSGMSLAAAHALSANLTVCARDATAERQVLDRLAAWAGQFTSHVSVVSPPSLLLEIEGSLRLFGGLEALRHVLRVGMAELGFTAVFSIAPTPLAARWLARAGDEKPIVDLPALTGRLFELPLGYLDFSESQYRQLHDMGLKTLGDCMRLPRDGLARRFGDSFITAIDRAFGRLPDPHAPFVAPPVYAAQLTLPGGVDSVGQLLFPLHRLLLELHGLLTARVAGVQELVLWLKHPHAPVTRIELGMARPTRDVKHLTELFRERFGKIRLPEQVEELSLSAPRLLPLAAKDRDFFIQKNGSAETANELFERLRARLGNDAVRGLAVLAEHRPERAWRYKELAEPAAQNVVALPEVSAERPLWLLFEPMRLETRDGRPVLDGVLQLEPDRERIETGWWDGNDIRRDYFIARDASGARLWIYRDLGAEQRWWLHGVFA
jgi:protein ImuB